jgi:hypothetical protein
MQTHKKETALNIRIHSSSFQYMLGLHQSEDFKITLHFVKPGVPRWLCTHFYFDGKQKQEIHFIVPVLVQLGADLSQMSQSSSEIDEKIRIARELKDEGNALVKEKEYRNAIKKYVKVSGMNIGVLLIYVVSRSFSI